MKPTSSSLWGSHGWARWVAIGLCIAVFTAIAGCGASPDDMEECGFLPPSAEESHDSSLRGLGISRSAMACGPGTAQEPPGRTFSKPVEGYASYAGQTKCDPTAKPGVSAFKDMVLKTYPCTGNYGIVRACSRGGTSEHKEGRAWDWKLNYPHPAADALLKWLLATDAQGNKHAMARRLGIMYMIWNRKIWKAYQSTKGWQPYTGASPHTDHVHFSFSWNGANKTTSYWSGDTAPPPRLDAKFVGQSSKGTYAGTGGAYFSVCPGQSFSLSFAVQNTGNIEWKDINQTTHGNAVRLGFKKGERLGIPTRVSVNDASQKIVKPGQSVTFTLKSKAPTKEGVFRTEWQMVSEMVAWFGPNMWQSLHVTKQPAGYGKACNTGKGGPCQAGVMKCSGGSLKCVPKEETSAEVCDGKDNDCDGSTDEGNPGGGKACTTNLKGPCKAGVMKCTGGKLVCTPKVSPGVEICDGKDNDCDGETDEGGACPNNQEPTIPGTEPTVTVDAGSQPESAASGPEVTVLDAGVSAPPKGGVLVLDAGTSLSPRPRTSGCACHVSTNSSSRNAWWFAICLFVLLGLFRRRF